MSDKNQKLPETLTWTAPAFRPHKRSSGWYLGFAVVAAGLIGFAIYDKSIVTLITFVLLILVVLILSLQTPKEIRYRITKTGINIGEVVYDYRVIKFFWITYNPPEVKTLNFETTAYINNKVSLQLGNQDPVIVKMILSNYLPEDTDRQESASEALARRLKI